ncbi:toxin-antitoxin system YwqK family antitoxin [Xenophilus sp. Marseille-Q4582]|uniref:toxin-antitoxin system YwqK family antitoxin n=1 Tax=Xenophilus sp. Marseille-Q4582 TaxID=2866600 RepID=UPI001CE44C91|nr:hypothetical protein [Xenophilus sp. Marseille-Q4582]
MKHRTARPVAAAILVAAGLAAPAFAVQDCELNGEPVNPANGHTTAGKTGLMRCKERDTGELRREQELQNGRFMGLVRFYDKGRLVKEHSVNEKGNMEGRAREFLASGQLLREATYANGRPVGLMRSFHPNGQLRRVSFHEEPGGERAVAEFNERGQLAELRCADRAVLAPALDDARLCGHTGAAPASVELFDARGRLRERLSLRAGQRVGAEGFHDNGQLAARMTLQGDQRTEQQFSADGVKRRERVSRVVERGSVRQRDAEYSERGTLLREQRWTPEGEALADDSYFLNGQPRRQARYAGAGDARTLEVQQFFDNGQRASVAHYALDARGAQRAIGTHQSFDEQGRRIGETVYDAQGRPSRERAWDAEGRLLRDDEVFEDGSRKAYRR